MSELGDLSPEEKQVVIDLRANNKEQYKLRIQKRIRDEVLDDFRKDVALESEAVRKRQLLRTEAAVKLNELFSDERVRKLLPKKYFIFKSEVKDVSIGENYTYYLSKKDFGNLDNTLNLEDLGLDSSKFEFKVDSWGTAMIKRNYTITENVEVSTFELGNDRFQEHSNPKIKFVSANVDLITKSEDVFQVRSYDITNTQRKYSAIGLVKRIVENNILAQEALNRFEFKNRVRDELSRQVKKLFGSSLPQLFYPYGQEWYNQTIDVQFKDGSSIGFSLDFTQDKDYNLIEPKLEMEKVSDAQELKGQEKMDYWVNKIKKQNS